MESALKKDLAQLFVAKKAEKTISYLFCGKYDKSAWGWSQTKKNIRKKFLYVIAWSGTLLITLKKKVIFFMILEKRFYSSNFRLFHKRKFQ